MIWLLFVAALVASFGYYRWTRRRLYQLSKQINRDVKPLPSVRTELHKLGDGTGQMKAITFGGRMCIKRGGLTDVWFGPKYFVVLADADCIEVVLKTCLEKEKIVSFIQLGIGNGSIFAPVSIWRPRRKIVAPIFSHRNLNTFVDIFSKQSSIMVSLLEQAPKGSFPLWDYLNAYAMDSVCESTLGIEINVQKNRDHPFPKAFDTFSRLCGQRMLSPWLYPLIVYKMTQQYSRSMKSRAEMWDFVGKIVKETRQQFNDNKSKSATNEDADKQFKTFLELLIESSGDQRLSDLELQEETLVMVAAGTDTSAVGASFTAVMLSRHKDVQEKVYQEVIEVLGNTDRPIVAEDLPRLKYVDAVIRETLRLHPPVPFIVRSVEKDVPLPIGVTLVDGCSVFIHTWAVHRNPKYWGPDPNEFRPERFFQYYDPRAFMPFSSGPRNCLGYQYAMMSMKTVVASLIRQYQVLPAEEDIIHDGLSTKYKPIQESFGIMMKDVNKFMVQLERRN